MIFKQDLLDAIHSLAIDQSILADKVNDLEKKIKKLGTKPKCETICVCKKNQEAPKKRGPGRPKKA